MSITSLEIARFKRLALRSSDVWQGGIVRMPAWIQKSDDDPPYRVRGAFWISTRTGLVWMAAEDEQGSAGAALAMHALAAFAKKYERDLLGRAARIEVNDAALADEMRALLDDAATTIAVVKDLPNVREAMRSFSTHAAERDGIPQPDGLLESPGVTVERLRGFAESAADCYRASPWEALDSEDLVEIDAPGVDPAMRCFIITGSTRDLRGFTFFPSRQHFEKFRRNPPGPGRPKPHILMISFDPIDWMPFDDVDAWLDYELPVAAPDAYPRPGFIRADDDFVRPNAQQLTLLEAVLRALAATTDDDFDAGRWTRRVDTADGAVDVRLSLPFLLEDMAARAGGHAPAFNPLENPMGVRLEMERAMRKSLADVRTAGAETLEEARAIVESAMPTRLDTPASVDPNSPPIERAQSLAYDAMNADGRRQIQLARQALAISRDCADAWSVLANRKRTLPAAVELLREAVAAGERALGAEVFTREAGNFWGLVHTRPYMRARVNLAQALEGMGQIDDAIAHYQDLLRLNPGDNQGVRNVLIACLLEAQRHAEAETLVTEFADDASAVWLYAAALSAFQSAGDSTSSRDRLMRAIEDNPHVTPLLTGERPLPDRPATYRLGSADEAAVCADLLLAAWTETPGAVFWLNTVRRDAKAARRSKSAKKTGK